MEKKPWQSKTNWTALIIAAGSFYPPIGDFISKNPEMFATIIAMIFGGLRAISKDKIVIS